MDCEIYRDNIIEKDIIDMNEIALRASLLSLSGTLVIFLLFI